MFKYFSFLRMIGRIRIFSQSLEDVNGYTKFLLRFSAKTFLLVFVTFELTLGQSPVAENIVHKRHINIVFVTGKNNRASYAFHRQFIKGYITVFLFRFWHIKLARFPHLFINGAEHSVNKLAGSFSTERFSN